MIVLYDELGEESLFDSLNDFDTTGKYVVSGTVGLWDGKREAYLPMVFNSIEDAIVKCNDGFNGYVSVEEKNYDRLFVEIAHHDGHNILEIRELTKLGEELTNNYMDIGEVIERKGATRNVNFTKNYL